MARAGSLPEEDRKILETANKSAGVVHLKAQAAGLGLRLDLVEWAKTQGTVHRRSIFETLQHHGPDTEPDAQHKPGTPDPIAYARAHNLPLDETLTAEKVIAQFNARSLIAPAAPAPVAGFSIAAPKTLHDLLHAWGAH